jgi:6,7-dimethyl-8-ribityllumazine synthase
MEQAIERAEPTRFNRGGEAAKSAIEMARVMEGIKGNKAANDRPTGVKNARRKR